jgi:hypothetical protein
MPGTAAGSAAEVCEEIDGASVLVAYGRILHRHAAGKIVEVVPFHGVNDVPLSRLRLSDHCDKVTTGLMDNGTVRGWGLSLRLPAPRCTVLDRASKGSFPVTARQMLPPAQEVEMQILFVGPTIEVRDCEPSFWVARALRGGARRGRVGLCACMQQLLRGDELGSHSIVNGNRQTESPFLLLKRAFG